MKSPLTPLYKRGELFACPFAKGGELLCIPFAKRGVVNSPFARGGIVCVSLYKKGKLLVCPSAKE
ncbi:hypothetical protein DRN50_06645 [Thermococci archaeon]|nr:MAG: hypothetical protein DRN50_06645 [Thermococci archaeon]